MEELYELFLGICPETKEMLLSPLEKVTAWQILCSEPDVFKLGKYFYPGMASPAPMPEGPDDIDCYLLGFLTERRCHLLSNDSRYLIELFVLGDRYKEYRRLLRDSQESSVSN